MALTTTDAIKLQIQNLITSHNYNVKFTLNNPSSFQAYLDTEQINFTASGSTQNVFVLLTKDANISIVILEILITNLTDSSKGSANMFIECPNYTGCEDNSYFLPLMLDFVP